MFPPVNDFDNSSSALRSNIPLPCRAEQWVICQRQLIVHYKLMPPRLRTPHGLDPSAGRTAASRFRV